MSHTSGPWTLEYVVDGAYAIHGTSAGDQVVIAERAPIPHRHDEFVANAHLITAAPLMYDFITKRAAEGDVDAASLIASI